MEKQDFELSLDMIHEFLNAELNAGFQKSGKISTSLGAIEMTFQDRIKNYYALVIDNYTLKNRGEIIDQINNCLRVLTNSIKPNNFYVIFTVKLSKSDSEYFLDSLSKKYTLPVFYDSSFIRNRINSSNAIQSSETFKTPPTKNLIYTDKELKRVAKESRPKTDGLDFELVAKKIGLADKIRSSSKSFWWINASKQFFEKLPIEVNDVYQYPIRINNGRRRANFSSLKIGDLLVGYDTKDSKEVYSILCVIREDDSFVFLKVAYILDKPISWKQVSEIESYSNSILIRSKVTATLNKLSSEQFIDILLKGISDPDKFSNQVMNKEFISFKNDDYFDVNHNILKEGKEEEEEENDDDQNIGLNSTLEKNNPSIASFSKDTPEGNDYLNIKEDVDAFSKVMALRDLPTPLSIALFGAWGSGKSFFMHKLEERIKELTDIENPENEMFCKNIIHIKFNAWAYLDANLWASLASIIFEQMYYHLEDISKTDSQIKNKIKEVTDKLDLIKDEKQKTLIQISDLKTQKTEAEKIIESKKKECSDLVETIQAKTTVEVAKRVFSELNVKQKIDDLISEHQLKPFVNSSAETYSELVRFTHELERIPFAFSGIFTKRSITFLVIISLVVLTFFILGFFVDFSILNKKVLLIPELIVSVLLFITPVFVRISNLLKRIRPAVTAINQIKIDVKNKIQSEVQLKEIEIEKNKQKLASLKTEITVLELKSLNIESDIKELKKILDKGIFFETFKSTIHDIHSSKAYKKHLGIISQLKNDFDILSELFIKQLPELNTDLNNSKFVDRIILYLDDLDRCSEDHVIEVLEAVNLLLAYPLFVVVVGVDHRWVKNALITKHYKQFGMHKDVEGYERIEPGSYLEKILQVPFHLNTPKKESIRYMIGELVKKNVDTQNQSNENQNKASSNISGQGNTTYPIMHGDTRSRKTVTIKSKSRVENNQLDIALYTEFDSKMLVLTDDEIELLPEFDFLLGSNPRTIKRYVNIYRIVRAHGDLPNLENNKQQKAVCMFLVALAIGECKSTFHKLSEMWHADVAHLRRINELFDHNNRIENNMRLKIEENSKINFLLDLNDLQIRNIGLFIERFSFKNHETYKSTKKDAPLVSNNPNDNLN